MQQNLFISFKTSISVKNTIDMSKRLVHLYSDSSEISCFPIAYNSRKLNLIKLLFRGTRDEENGFVIDTETNESQLKSKH